MPALLTRMCSAPSAATISLNAASTAAAVRDVEALGDRRAARGDDGGGGLAGGRLVGGVVEDDLGARAPERDGDGAPDAARSAGDERDLPLELTHLDRSSPASAASAAMASGSPADAVVIAGAIRRTSPASTFPAPTSTARVTPMRREALRPTLPSAPAPSPAASAARARASGPGWAPPRRCVTTGTAGAAISTRASSAASRSAAGCMSAQWKGALTASGFARFAPRALAAAQARSTAPLWPAITT